MNPLPSFVLPLLSDLEVIYKQANGYKDLNLAKDQLLMKISHDIGVDGNTSPEQQLINASNHYRSLFKEAALKAGYSETYVRGVFNEAEKLCKKAIEAGPLLEPLEQSVEPAIGNAISKGISGVKGLFKSPVVGSTPMPQGIPRPPMQRPNVPRPTSNQPPITAQNAAPQAGGVAAPVDRSLWEKITGKGVGPGWWQGSNSKWDTAKSMAGGAGVGSLADLATGMPGIGTATGAAVGGARALGVRRALLGGGALYGGSKLLGASGAPAGAEQGIFNNVSGGDLPMSDPRSQQNDLIPGVSNGWTGTIGGGLAAALLAKQYGLTGIPGMAATLLGAYGGHQYLPQMLSKLKSGGGGMGGLFQSPGYGGASNPGVQPNNIITPDSIARGIGENQYANGGQ